MKPYLGAIAVLHNTPRSLERIANEQPQLGPARVARVPRLRFGCRAGATRLPLIVSARDLAGASFAGVLSAVAFSAAECVSKKMPVPAGAATRTDARQSREHPAGDRPIQALGGALDYALMRELRLGAALLRRLIGDLGALLVGGSLLKFRSKVGVWTSSTGGLAAKPAADRVAQNATLAGPAPKKYPAGTDATPEDSRISADWP